MREIKFRGQCVLTGEMLYGCLIQLEHVTRIGWMDEKEGFCSATIDKETLVQFTGLKDINNKDVYEKDIVEDYKGKRFIVEYNLFYAYMLYPSEDRTSYMAMYPTIKLEVIGNLYENPELLEVGAND